MPQPNVDPGTALGCAIIARATKDWKKNRFLINGNRELDRLCETNTELPYWLQSEHDSLLAFFHGRWFNFLFESAVTRTTRSKMFKALGIPAQERGG